MACPNGFPSGKRRLGYPRAIVEVEKTKPKADQATLELGDFDVEVQNYPRNVTKACPKIFDSKPILRTMERVSDARGPRCDLNGDDNPKYGSSKSSCSGVDGSVIGRWQGMYRSEDGQGRR